MTSSTPPLLTVSKLTRIFNLSDPWLQRLLTREPRRLYRAVDGLSFSIPAGSTFALVGESGCGKSTTARMIAGLLRPSEGDVVFGGRNIWSSEGKSHPDNDGVQMIFQDPYASLNPRWRVDRIVAEPLSIQPGAVASETADRVAELLKVVGMDGNDGKKYPHQFSGGQRQRIAIARALAVRPRFIVCDEPTSALDVSVQAQILNLMRDLQQEYQLTYLLISHNLAVVRHMADRIGVMRRGAMVEQADTEELFESPRHEYTRALLEAIPDPQAALRRRSREPQTLEAHQCSMR
jgi:peptide/nickel transport system ATP-binding protein